MGREAGLGDDRGESARVASGGHGQRACVQGRRRPVRKLARGGTGAAGTVAGAAEDEERRGVLDVRRRGTPRRL
jgi:hypothetical protein